MRYAATILIITFALLCIACKKKGIIDPGYAPLSYSPDTFYYHRKIKCSRFQSLNDKIRLVKYFYDVNGRLTHSVIWDSVFFNQTWLVSTGTVTPTYNGSNRYASEKIQSGSSSSLTTYSYDSGGKILRAVITSGTQTDSVVYTHNGNKCTAKKKGDYPWSYRIDYYTDGDIDSALNYDKGNNALMTREIWKYGGKTFFPAKNLSFFEPLVPRCRERKTHSFFTGSNFNYGDSAYYYYDGEGKQSARLNVQIPSVYHTTESYTYY